MKSIKQVLTLLSQYNIANSIELENIQKYCDKKFSNSQPISYNNDTSQIISFEQFKHWFEKGFGQGDILKARNMDLVGLCSLATLSYVALDIYLENGVLTKANITFPMNAVINAPTYDRRIFKQKLAEYNEESIDVVDQTRYSTVKPVKGKLIKFKNISTNQSGIAPYQGSTLPLDNGKEELIVGCVLYTSGIVDLNETLIGHAKDIVWENTTLRESEKFNEALKQINKTWNNRLKRIEPAQLQDNFGKPYWYLDDLWQPKSAIDKNRQTENRRRCAGNYFFTLKECAEFKTKLELLRKEMFTEA